MRGTRHTNKHGDYDIQIYKFENGAFVSTLRRRRILYQSQASLF